MSKDGHSLAGYIRSGTGGGSDPGSLERTILALRAAGLPAPAQLAALRRVIGSGGSVSGQTNLTAFAVLALRAAGVAPSGGSLRWLVRQQDRDGGFNYGTAGGASDVDDTGAVLEALGGGGRVGARAAGFIERHQNRDGGFPSQPGGESNAQSTAWAVQGLVAAGTGAGAVDRGLGYLGSLIAPDGHVRYSRSSDQTPVWVTAQALMALARKPLPLAAVPLPAPQSGHRARPGAHRSAKAAGRARQPRRSGRARPVRSSHGTLTVAADLGIASALALAPVGLG